MLFDHRLKWDIHISELGLRITRILNGLKIIRRKLTLKRATTIITAQALSIMYYAFSAWLTPSLGRKEIDDFEKIHFKALRVVVRDYKQRMNREIMSIYDGRVWQVARQLVDKKYFRKCRYEDRTSKIELIKIPTIYLMEVYRHTRRVHKNVINIKCLTATASNCRHNCKAMAELLLRL